MAALGNEDFDAVAGAVGENFFQEGAAIEIDGDMEIARLVGGIEVDLLEQRGEKLAGREDFLIFPVEIAAINHAAGAKVEEIDAEERRLGVPGEDVRIVAHGCGHLLAFFDFFESSEQVAEGGGFFKALFVGGTLHALGEASAELGLATVEKEADVAGGLGVAFVGDKSRHARAVAAVDVIFEAGAFVGAHEVHGAGGHLEPFVDELDDAIREAGGEVWAEVERAVFFEAAGDVYAREFLGGGEFDIGVGLVVAEKDVEAGLILLDEIVFKGEGFAFVVDDDVVEAGCFVHERGGFGVERTGVGKVGADAGAKRDGHADVDHGSLRVAEEIHSGLGRKRLGFLFQVVHGAE